jgi:hypothetical protein
MFLSPVACEIPRSLDSGDFIVYGTIYVYKGYKVNEKDNNNRRTGTRPEQHHRVK